MPKPKKYMEKVQQSAPKFPRPIIPFARLPVFTRQKLVRELTRASGIGRDGRRVVFQSFVMASRPRPPLVFRREKEAVEYLRKKFGRRFFERRGAMAVLFREWKSVMGKAAAKGYRSLTPDEAGLADSVMAACRSYQQSRIQKQMKK